MVTSVPGMFFLPQYLSAARASQLQVEQSAPSARRLLPGFYSMACSPNERAAGAPLMWAELCLTVVCGVEDTKLCQAGTYIALPTTGQSMHVVKPHPQASPPPSQPLYDVGRS